MADQRNKWEDQWHEAFEGAETPPSPHVWKHIEGELIAQQTGKYRQGFLLYRAIAATLLLLIAGLSWYIITQPKNDNQPRDLSNTGVSQSPAERELSEANVSTQPPEQESTTVGRGLSVDRTDRADSAPPVSDQAASEGAEGSGQDAAPSGRQAPGRQAPTLPSLAHQDSKLSPTPLGSPHASGAVASDTGNASDQRANIHPTSDVERDAQRAPSLTAADYPSSSVASVPPLPSLAAQEIGNPIAVYQLPSDKTDHLYQVPQPSMDQAKEKKTRRPSFFAGLAVAPSYFDPQLETSAPSPATLLNVAGPSGAPGQNNGERTTGFSGSVPSANSGANDRPELSFTYGIDVGMKLFEHWVIESGIDYNRFGTSAQTRWAVADVVSGNRYPYLVSNSYQLSDATPAPTTATTISNSYEFISVPVQVGYQVAVSRLNFTLSSGVAANFFLGNDISAPASPLADVRVSASDSQGPFRSQYYSGVLSGGVNYNIIDHYSFSLTPSYTFALTELTHDDSALSSQPYSFGINVGFQYQF